MLSYNIPPVPCRPPARGFRAMEKQPPNVVFPERSETSRRPLLARARERVRLL